MLICIIPKRQETWIWQVIHQYIVIQVCYASWKDKTIFCHIWQKVSQLSCGSINFYYFFVIYFYSKEFVSLSQKLDKHTTNSSKVRRVTLMVESSLGISNVLKVIKEKKKRKNTQNKSKTHGDFGERRPMTVSVFPYSDSKF